MMRICLFIATLCFVVPVEGQEREIVLTPESTGEGKLIRRAVFDGSSLWGYINGGADLYLEYGFTNLTVHEIDFRGSSLRFDLYRMNDPAAAYGIFSVSTFMCDSVTGPGEFNCSTKWQIQAVRGNYYLSAILGGGTPEELEYAKGIACNLLAGIDSVKFEPGFPFKKGVFAQIKGDIRLCRGRLGLENGIPFRNEALSSTSFTALWHISEIEGFDSLALTAIKFKDYGERIAFLESQVIDEEDNTRIYQLSDDLTVLVVSGAGKGLPVGRLSDWFSGMEDIQRSSVN